MTQKNKRQNPLVSSTLIAKHAQTISKCEKQKVYSEVFHVIFFMSRVPFFTFRILCQGRYLCKKLKDFVIYFFAALLKHEIRKVCSECFVFHGVFCENIREI